MFKKLLVVLVIAVAGLLLTSCGKREFKADGVYTAFSTELQSAKKPQVTLVSVTIEDDKIVDFDIDCYQSDFNATSKKYAFKESKKTLGFKYGMHNSNSQAGDEVEYTKQDLSTEAGLEAYKDYLEATGKLEWFQQAEKIEEFFVEKGPDALEVNDDKVITNVEGGVTIKDGGYSDLAKEAIQLAKEGKAQAVLPSGDSVVWATAVVKEDGTFESLTLDTRQGTYSDDNADDVKDVFKWNEKSKQELQYLYGMHNSNSKPEDEVEYTKQDLSTEAGLTAYKNYLQETGKKEWFEQADLFADFVLENGLTDVKLAENGKLDHENSAEALAGVSVTAKDYVAVFTKLFDNFK